MTEIDRPWLAADWQLLDVYPEQFQTVSTARCRQRGAGSDNTVHRSHRRHQRRLKQSFSTGGPWTPQGGHEAFAGAASRPELNSHARFSVAINWPYFYLVTIKTKSRNHLHVRSDIRLAVSKNEPNINSPVRRSQEQVSHWRWIYSQFLIFTASLCLICLCLFTARLYCFFVLLQIECLK